MSGVDFHKKYLNLTECAELIKRTENGVRGLVKRHAIPFRKPSGRLIFIRYEVERWIESAPGLNFENWKRGTE